MKKNKPTWQLELNDDQYNCIVLAVEYFHRMMCGQIDVLDDISEHNLSSELVNEIKEQLFPELRHNESYGWNGGSPNRKADIMQAHSYQIYREMLHQYVIRKGISNVYSSPTLTTDKAIKPIIKYL